MPFNTPLEAAIAHLIARGDIKSSADVARDLGLKSRGTVSSYAKGGAKMSDNFQTLFENKYNIKLQDFNNISTSSVPNKVTDYKDKALSLLEKHVALLEKEIAAKDKIIAERDARITLLLQKLDSEFQVLRQASLICTAYTQAQYQGMLQHRAAMENIPFAKMKADMGKLYVAALDEMKQQMF